MLIDKDKLTKIRNRPTTICHQNCGGTVKKKPIAVAQAKPNNNQEGLVESFWPCFIGFALLGWWRILVNLLAIFNSLSFCFFTLLMLAAGR